MRIQRALGQLHRLADHDAHRHVRDTEFSGNLQRLADEVAEVDERLRGQVGVFGLDETLATGTGIDDQALRAEGTADFHLAADGAHEGV